ncbi:phage major capsid protein, P2 family [Pseudoxanthomonas wuyuanensis]|uniref:Phage major capsid protein, P2 family n=1 Tax=Pseudoxanthomonas wuyuanensis TaxID=1073196 RepID=A0A286D522_9GAMM|nr:phage major capsid protein, P2 family [Pseudoxanthomonas wuyuanensis]KAF1719814.1 phage major capsid protein, P2 family [Pseudoxanthomonas wuyuanensis]SOD53694.1 phage major capsid protein, P2 family [Pseudoxanthomonas wuyuanensis]
MRNNTRRLFNAYLAQVAQLNQVDSATVVFNVDPVVQQKLEQRTQESSEFLNRIQIIGVEELKGDKVGIGVAGTIAGRTDTTGAAVRQPRDVGQTDSTGYECKQTDFDTGLKYSLLDAWAHRPEFQTILRDAIVKRQALDRLLIGFHGTSAAATTNREANPMLEDVNIGWLQKYRSDAPARVLDTGKTADKVIIGPSAGADYKNLDALVYDAVSNLIDPWHRRDPGLVVVVGRSLLHDKYFPLVNQDQPSTEKLATDVILSQRRLGGLQAAEVPYCPDNAILITSLGNLSLYWQIGGRRRHVKEEPEKNRVANYESSNDAYVVEDYGLGCVIENIEIEA